MHSEGISYTLRRRRLAGRSFHWTQRLSQANLYVRSDIDPDRVVTLHLRGNLFRPVHVETWDQSDEELI